MHPDCEMSNFTHLVSLNKNAAQLLNLHQWLVELAKANLYWLGFFREGGLMGAKAKGFRLKMNTEFLFT